MQRGNALRLNEIEENGATGSDQAAKEYPRHFKYTPVLEQVRHYEHNYPFLSATPTLKFLESSEWHADDLPEGAHAWAAFPRAHQICEQYSVAVATVTRQLAHERPTADRTIRIPEPLRRTSRLLNALKELAVQQPFDIQVVPVQMGGAHRAGFSVDETRDIHAPHEIPMGFFEGLNLLMVNRGRLESPHDIGIIFGGDRFGPDFAPAASFESRALMLNSAPVEGPAKGYSEATWFLMK